MSTRLSSSATSALSTACNPATRPPFHFLRYRPWSPPPAGGPNATSLNSISAPTSTPSARLRATTQYLVDYLRTNSLRMANHKCCLDPMSEIDWIGKHVGHHTVCNTDARARQLAGVFLGFSTCHGVRVLRRMLGWVSWYASHFPVPMRNCTAVLLTASAGRRCGPFAFALHWVPFTCNGVVPAATAWRSFTLTHLQATARWACATTRATAELPPKFPNTCLPLTHARRTGSKRQNSTASQRQWATTAVARQSALIFTENQACGAWLQGAKIPLSRQQAHYRLAAVIGCLCELIGV